MTAENGFYVGAVRKSPGILRCETLRKSLMEKANQQEKRTRGLIEEGLTFPFDFPASSQFLNTRLSGSP